MATHPIFGRVHVVEKAPANLLSLGYIRNTFHVAFNDEDNQFVLTPKSRSLQRITSPLVFPMHPISGVYMYSMAASNRYRSTIIAMPTQAPFAKHYTPKQLQLASEARHLHNVLGHPNDEAFCKLLDNGGILDCHLTSSAVRLSTEVLGPCTACAQAQMRDQSCYREKNAENVSEPAERIGDNFIIDITFVRMPNGTKLQMLLLLEELTNCAFIIKLKSKGQRAIEEALYKAIGYLRSQKCRVLLVKSDHEANIRACSAFLGNLNPSVRYKSSAPGTHAKRVERFTQVLRDKLRVLVKAAGIPIPPDMYYSLILAAVSARNQVPNLNSGALAPFQHITNWKPSLKGSLRHKFGDIIIVRTPNIPASDKDTDRGERGIYLYPNKGMNHATVRLLDGKSAGEIVSRDLNPRKMRPIPLTDDIITILNQARVKQGCLPSTSDSSQPDIIIEHSGATNSNAIATTENQSEEHWWTNHSEEPATALEDFYPPDSDDSTATEFNPMVPDSTSLHYEPPPVTPSSPTASSTRVEPHTPVDYPQPAVEHPPEVPAPPSTPPPRTVAPPSPERPERRSETTPLRPTIARFQQSELPQRQHSVTNSQSQSQSDFVYEPKPQTREFRFPRAAQRKGPTFPVVDQQEAVPSYATAMATFDEPHHRSPDVIYNDLAMNISLQRAMKTMPDKAKPAILAELKQLKEMKVLEPVKYDELTAIARKACIYAFLFLKDKFKADGTFDKFKGRLVANKPAWTADPTQESMDPSSPTVDFLTACIILNLICYRKMKTAIIDVKGAYLNADINEIVHIILDATTAAIFVEEYPQYKSMLRRDGSLCCLVRKALYGLPQSGKLWYMHLKETLTSMGYKCQSEHDKCLFTCDKPDGTTGYILVYVDDLLIAADTDEELDRVISSMRSKYKDISIQRGQKYSWLGLTLNFAPDNSSVTISQEGYIADIIRRYSVLTAKSAKSPCASNFLQRPNSGPSSEPTDSTIFRSQLMAAAYLAIRSRPDIRFAVSHLASRSASPTKHDQKCLDHLYNYISTTKQYKLRIRPTSLQLTAYIDASFAIHGDGKGHTGIIITMGDQGVLYIQSSKQKLLGHHSTECELIAVNDGLFTLQQIRGLYNILGLPEMTVNIRQDNSSAMQISLHGQGNAKRSKYMTVRVEHIKSAIEEKKIQMTKCATAEMHSDMLTKPIYGKKLKYLISPYMEF